jgi:TRAP-type mannitol/chloroaromatic compound transport system permease small subunit
MGFVDTVDRWVDRIGRAAAWLTLAIVLLMAANVLLSGTCSRHWCWWA